MLSRSRSIVAVCLTVLHLCVVPATHVLHIGCTGEHHSHDAAAHGCAHSCCHHHSQCPPNPNVAAINSEERQSSQAPEREVPQPHDSGNCAICQVAFSPGLMLAIVVPPEVFRTLQIETPARPQQVVTNSLSPTQLRGPPSV